VGENAHRVSLISSQRNKVQREPQREPEKRCLIETST